MLAFPCFAAAVIGFAVTGIGYFPIYSMVQVYNSRIQRPKKPHPQLCRAADERALSVFASSGYVTLAGRIFSLGSEVSVALLGAVLLFILLGAAVLAVLAAGGMKNTAPAARQRRFSRVYDTSAHVTEA